MPRYYVHHESSIVWKQQDDSRLIEVDDEEVEEIDEGLFHSFIENGYQEYEP